MLLLRLEPLKEPHGTASSDILSENGGWREKIEAMKDELTFMAVSRT